MCGELYMHSDKAVVAAHLKLIAASMTAHQLDEIGHRPCSQIIF